MTLAALFVSSLAMAQDYPEYPFPYNPDGNADGYIGLTDLLDLLVVYGQEYPGSFYGDSTGAILNLGQMPPHKCVREANSAGRHWRVLTFRDFWNNFNSIAEIGQSNFGVTNQFEFFCYDFEGRMSRQALIFDEYNTIAEQTGGEGTPEYTSVYSAVDWSAGDIYHFSANCVIATETLPEIEYYIVEGDRPTVINAVSDSLSNGWRIAGGVQSRGSSSIAWQAIMRFAQ